MIKFRRFSGTFLCNDAIQTKAEGRIKFRKFEAF